MIMAHNGQLSRMFLAVCFVLLGVSTTRAQGHYISGDERKLGLLRLSEYGLDRADKGDDTAGSSGGEDAVVPDWNGQQIHAGLDALKHSLQSRYPSVSKRSWLPGTQTGLFGKRGSHWLNPQDKVEKRQLWANQQSGLFGKRNDDREQSLARWTVKRSAEEGDFGRERRKGGVPHVFQSGGIFGKRSADNWETRIE